VTLYNKTTCPRSPDSFLSVSCVAFLRSFTIHNSHRHPVYFLQTASYRQRCCRGRHRFRLAFEEGSPPTVVQCVVFRGFSTVMPEHWFGIRHGYLLRRTQESPCNHLIRSYITTGTEARPLHNPHKSRNLVRTFNTKPGIQSCNQLKLFSYKRDPKVNAEFRTCRQNPNRGDRGKGLGHVTSG
jgi:hypothetical protein